MLESTSSTNFMPITRCPPPKRAPQPSPQLLLDPLVSHHPHHDGAISSSPPCPLCRTDRDVCARPYRHTITVRPTPLRTSPVISRMYLQTLAKLMAVVSRPPPRGSRHPAITTVAPQHFIKNPHSHNPDPRPLPVHTPHTPCPHTARTVLN